MWLLTIANRANSNPATGAVPYVVNRLSWFACSSLSVGTRFGTDASLAGVQNSDAHEARNWTMYTQVSWFAKPTDKLIGMVMYSTALITSPMIMFIRRSNLSATAPASGPKISAGSSEVSQTPLTAYAPPPARPSFAARKDSASRLSQSPRLDSERAIHRRRNDLIDSTPEPPAPKGDLKFTGLGYRAGQGRVASSTKLRPSRHDNSDG